MADGNENPVFDYDNNDILITEHYRSLTGSEFLCQALVSAGVTHIFGGHGGAIVPLIDAIVAHPSLTWVYCRCEVNASMAAAAYAKLHGSLGCCVATSGPGASHLLSGLIDADQDRVPLLCITGMKSLGKTRHSDFQDIDQSSIFRMAGLAFSETVSHVDQLLPLARNAFTVAITTNRCAHLALPINIQQERVVARTHFCLGTTFQSRLCIAASTVQIEAFAMALRHEIMTGRRVLLACGYRANVKSVGYLIERLAELMHAPILTSFDGKGTVNEHHPLSYGVVGVYGNAGTSGSVDLLENCDTVVGVCVSDYAELLTDGHGLQVRKFLQVEERLVAGDSMRFSPKAVLSCEYLEDTLRSVIKVLEGHLLRSSMLEGRVTLSSQTTANIMLRSKSITDDNDNIGSNLDVHEPESTNDVWSELRKESYVKPVGTPSTFLEGKELSTSPCIYSTEHCHPAVFFQLMSEYLDNDAVICADIGDNSLWLASALPAKRGQRFLTSEHLGIMGYAINSGLAASLSSSTSTGQNESRKQTLVVAGDGGVQMSINELATMRDHNAKNVLVVVICNSRLGRVQNETWGPGLNADGCHIGSPNYVDLFNAYGYPNGLVLSTCDNEVISETIKKGWESAEKNGCCVIELHQDPKVHPVMFKLSLPDSLSKRPWDTEASYHALPSIDVDNVLLEKPRIDEWLSGLNRVVKSEPFWLDNGDIFTISPSEVVETLFASLSVYPMGEPPVLFKTANARATFDTQFQASVLNAMTAKTLLIEVVTKGMSNGHPLKFQFLACPPNFSFRLHSHASVELIVPVVGELWERYLYGAIVNPTVLSRMIPLEVAEKDSCTLYMKPSDGEIDQVAKSLQQTLVEKLPSLGRTGKFVDRVIKEGFVCYNEVGSIHQSYTKDHGCLIFVLWCGAHADIDQLACDCTGIDGSEGLFSP